MTYHRNPTAMIPIFDGAAPIVFTELDLAPFIGDPGRYAVELACDREYYEFRPAGNTSIGFPASAALRGCSGGYTRLVTVGNICGLTVFTNLMSKVEWIQSSGGVTKVYLLGWHDVFAIDPELEDGYIYAHSNLPAVWWGGGGWNILDMSGYIDSEHRLLVLEYVWDAGQVDARCFYIKHDGGALLPHHQLVFAPLGPSLARLSLNHPVQIMTPTNSSGRIEQASSTVQSDANIGIHGYLNDWVRDDIAIVAGMKPPLVFGNKNLDVGALIPGAIGGMCYLIVTRPGVPGLGTIASISFRGSGDTLDPTHPTDPAATRPRGTRHISLNAEENAYVWVEVGLDGYIEWQANNDAYPIDITAIGHIPCLFFSYVGMEQTSLNTVDITFDGDPKALDPVDPTDALYLDNYAVTGPVAPFSERILQAVTHESWGVIRLWFDGPLVPSELYSISISGIETYIGEALFPLPATGSFVAFGTDFKPIPLRVEGFDIYDLKNPQVSRDADGASLGTLSVDETGDLAVETRRQYLKKRILRRCTTKPGGFTFLENYGLLPDEKSLLRPARLRKLQQEAETQIAEEPGVVSVRASVRELVSGVIWLRLNVVDQYGSLTIETTIGNE